MIDKDVDDILAQLEDEDADAAGKKAMSVLGLADQVDPDTKPKGPPTDEAGPADADGSNDDHPTVDPTEKQDGPSGQDDEQPAGGDKLAELVASLSEEEKAKLLALLTT